MNKTLSFKLGMIALLMLLLLIPLLLINGLIDERQSLRDSVVRDIAQSASFDQQLSGPLLVVPYRKYQRRWIDKDGERTQETSSIAGHLYFLPETFDADLDVETELRARGIYQARLFHAKGRISGRFKLPERWGIDKDFDDYQFDKPFLVVGISDIRGIENGLELTFDERKLPFEAGTGLSWIAMEHRDLAAGREDGRTITPLQVGGQFGKGQGAIRHGRNRGFGVQHQVQKQVSAEESCRAG